MSNENCCNVELTLSESPILTLDALGDSYIGEMPTMSTVQKGGAKVGAGLEVDSDEFLNIAPSGVVSSMIDNAAITTEKLADGAVTADKIDSEVLDGITADISYSGSGESVTADDASYLASLTVDGKAVQDGTPTPSNPVDVQVVEGRNLWSAGDQTFTRTKTISLGKTFKAGVYTFSSNLVTTYTAGNSFRVLLMKGSTEVSDTYAQRESNTSIYIVGTVEASGEFDTIMLCAAYNWGAAAGHTATYSNIQLEKGSTATQYVPYGSIGLKVGSTIMPINLNGNVLASLSDDTKDVLTVDSVGHCVATINAKKLVFNGSTTPTLSSSSSTLDNWKIGAGTSIRDWKYNDNNSLSSENTIYNSYPVESKGFSYATGPGVSIWSDGFYLRATKGQFADGAALQSYLQANPVEVWYQLATPQTIDLGYIDLPAIPDGATISITAQVTPTISASWWARGAAAIGEALQAVCARFKAIEAAIAELATA